MNTSRCGPPNQIRMMRPRILVSAASSHPNPICSAVRLEASTQDFQPHRWKPRQKEQLRNLRLCLRAVRILGHRGHQSPHGRWAVLFGEPAEWLVCAVQLWLDRAGWTDEAVLKGSSGELAYSWHFLSWTPCRPHLCS